MKKLTLLVVTLLLMQAKGYVIQIPTDTAETRIAPVGWVHIQKLLLPLFINVCEESTDPVVLRLNEEFKLDPSNGVYLNPEVISNLQNLRATKGLLPKGEIFTEYDADHLNELKVIYEVLYNAKDFDTFYKAASWARQNVNCGLFVDAIYLAIMTRRDTERVSVPAPYEVLPNYFIRKDFILQASSLIMGETITPSDSLRNEGNAYILDVNYTTNFYDDSDDKLAYFHEDIGLNSYYYMKRLNNLMWIADQRNLQKSICGEYIYNTMKQLMARYNLERYSNGLYELEGIDWDYSSNEYSYDPMLIYSNGKALTPRSTNNGDNEILTMLKNIENNLPALVIHMRDGGYNKSVIINHLMEILVTGPNSYENLALQYLSGEKTISSVPTVLEHYMTTIRDPIFWKLNKKIVDLVENALQVLPSYTRSELYFPGVEVQNIEVKKIMTAFDNFEFDVTNALKSENEDTKFFIKINQQRLNHKPFSFKIPISSLVAEKSMVKLYIGPKVMPGELAEKKKMLLLIDSFEYNLKIGSNIITRATNDMINFSSDFISLDTLSKKVLDAEFGIDTLPLKSIWAQTGFPSRLILPKGTTAGLPLHVFVFVAPFVKATIGGPRNTLDLNLDAILSPGYPLDLGIEIQQLFNLPNALVKDILITHKTESTTANRGTNAYNPGSSDMNWQPGFNNVDYETHGGLLGLGRPKLTQTKFDYKSKKNKYGKKYEKYTKKDTPTSEIQDINNGDDTSISSNINDDTEPENMEVVNNIYINPGVEHDKVVDYMTDSDNVIYTVTPDKSFDFNDIYRTTNLNFDEGKNKLVRENSIKVKRYASLKMPQKRFSNIFNIIIEPIKKDEDEDVFE